MRKASAVGEWWATGASAQPTVHRLVLWAAQSSIAGGAHHSCYERRLVRAATARYTTKVGTKVGGEEDLDPVERRICSKKGQIGFTTYITDVNPSTTTIQQEKPHP